MGSSYDRMKESLEDHLEIAACRAKPSRTFAYSDSDIKDIRSNLKLTQQGMADILGISRATIEHWEYGVRKPTGAARALLRILEREPKAAIRALKMLNPQSLTGQSVEI